MKPSPPTGSSALSQANPFLDVSTEESLQLLRRGFAYRAAFGFFLFLAFGIAYFIPVGSPENHLPQLLCALLITIVNVPYYFVLKRAPDRILRYHWVGPIIDLTAITAIIYFLGGMDAVYAFPFYAIVILYSAVTHRRPWHFIVAGLSSLLLLGLFLTQSAGLLPLVSNLMDLRLTVEQQGIVLIAFIAFFFATAIIASFLSEALFERTRALARVNALVEESNRALESRIAERTREIAAQNTLLQQQNVQIAEANRLKTEYLININHELRTPLTSILGYGRMLLSYELDKKKQREFVESILRQADVLNHFVSTLNRIEEIESGVMLLRRAPVQMPNLVEEALVTMRPRIEERDLHVERLFEEGVDLPVRVDSEKMSQVLLNFLDNALKLTPREGKIEISIERKGDALEVGIHDSGPGILPEYLEHVFERFKQVEPALSQNHGGLGIGLSLVKSIVALHGGKTWAESPGRLSGEGTPGTSFYFTIPLKTPKETAPRRDAA